MDLTNCSNGSQESIAETTQNGPVTMMPMDVDDDVPDSFNISTSFCISNPSTSKTL